MSLDVPQMLFIGIALAIPTTIVVVYLGLDLTLRDRAVTATIFGRIWFELPYEQVWKVEVAPMRMRVTVFGNESRSAATSSGGVAEVPVSTSRRLERS